MVFTTTGSIPMTRIPESVTVSVVPSPVARKSASLRRGLASTSCSQPRSIILVTPIHL